MRLVRFADASTRVLADFAARLPFILPQCKKKQIRENALMTHQKDTVTEDSIGLVGAICIVALI